MNGEKPLLERHQIIQKLKNLEVRVLIATNIASRGLDIP